MRKFVTILGTLLIATILLSGSAVAVTYYIYEATDWDNCMNPLNAEDEPDGSYASLAEESTLGWIELDFGIWGAMIHDQMFTVYGYIGGETEEYDVWVINMTRTWTVKVGSGEDTSNEEFYTPSDEGQCWRWVLINATSGQTGREDELYGPEIDKLLSIFFSFPIFFGSKKRKVLKDINNIYNIGV